MFRLKKSPKPCHGCTTVCQGPPYVRSATMEWKEGEWQEMGNFSLHRQIESGHCFIDYLFRDNITKGTTRIGIVCILSQSSSRFPLASNSSWKLLISWYPPQQVTLFQLHKGHTRIVGKTRQSSHDQTWARCFPTGGDLLLLCPVSGHPIVQISWTRGTQSHHQSIHITNITRGTQSAHSVNKLAGRYRLCIVWMSNWVSLKIANEHFLVDYQK